MCVCLHYMCINVFMFTLLSLLSLNLFLCMRVCFAVKDCMVVHIHTFNCACVLIVRVCV